IRVVVANTRKLRSITEAKAKTDRLDARTLARLLVSGLLDEVWTPDERTRTLRRLTNRRERLVRARTRAKNEVHGVLARNLCERPPVTDAFEHGRAALAGPAGTARLPSKRSLGRRCWLMSVPGVNVQTAATFMAAVGDVGRFSSPRKLVSYL